MPRYCYSFVSSLRGGRVEEPFAADNNELAILIAHQMANSMREMGETIAGERLNPYNEDGTLQRKRLI